MRSELQRFAPSVLERGAHVRRDQLAALDPFEAVPLGHLSVLCFQQSPGNSAGPEVDVARELLVEGERERVKLCENPECRWASYDTTRNRRRRWCDPTECGNVFKVPQFRARRRAEESARAG